MTDQSGKPPRPERRGFLKAGGAAVAAGVGLGGPGAARAALTRHAVVDPMAQVEPFYGEHQAGIVTTQQSHTYVAAFDIAIDKRDELIALLRDWTVAAERMTRGQPAGALEVPDGQAAGDSGEVIGVGPAALTVTFGFGPGLFTTADGHDRFGLASRRPAALVDLPRFNGDQLVAEKTGGDLFVQACANDAQVAFHAVRQLARRAYGALRMRWGQAGFLTGAPGQTPRNLMGFKDGTNNPPTGSPAAMQRFVWAGAADAPWMAGGTYTVVRRIRITLEHWDRTDLAFQEQVFGRHKVSGAPLGGRHEFDALDLQAADRDGNAVIPDNSHIRLSNRATNDGAQILRRSYSYNDSTNFYIERWPPWRQEVEYDAGLIFIAHQSDPRTGFIPINQKLSKFDLMNQFTTHVGSAIFAVPPGVREGAYIGAPLFES
ncbi:iron uptake transporter deferrochelatase/peroxidase subunit [Burkholderia plantarii]|uniref:iron uptake transporter deferrochelatase/peroxidase subunit n=1 Tax=Burkholderia plantarii TaxID=41899 RepID=UPI0018DCCDA9|nr:iron uptake transporter deferrochelatase/peroxidase subunit [Burkholderia plantarii]MBI0330254.1 deferrochelatase/peroxidase EfeB [Burkholderia plantarii]